MGGSKRLVNNELEHPKDSANCLSNLFFCWPLPLFWKGYKGELTDDVLFNPLQQHESTHLGDKLEHEWKYDRIVHDDKPSLWRILWKIFGKRIIAYGFQVFFLEFIIRLVQPLALWRLMLYFSPDGNVDVIEAHISIGVIVVASFANVICYHSCMFGLQRLGMQMKIACCSLIYRKSLKLRKNRNVKSGTVMNLLSNDVNRFDTFLTQIHYLWVAPLDTFVIMFLLYTILSPLAVAGFGIFFLFIPLQTYLGKVWSNLRAKTANKTDERLRLLNEVICGIQVIKMYTWEKIFVKLINTVRRHEIGHIQLVYYLKAFHSSFNKYVTRSATFICILCYVLTGHTLRAEYVFVVKSFYALLKDCVTLKFPLAIGYLAETMISIGRIEEFLLCEEIAPSDQNDDNGKTVGIVLKNVSAKCDDDFNVLSNVTITVNANDLVAIVGPMASGKTSLLNVILNELVITEGSRSVNGRISYAPQQPWLFAGTIKENILFGEHYDHCRYKEVIEMCALSHDFDMLPFGDNSIVGDRGVTLSGGQKGRINLARAVYKNVDIYLLDDPFAAVDSSVSQQLFEQCILTHLSDKCVVLVTHQLQYLKKIDTIYALDKGRIETWGNCHEIWASSERLHSALNEDDFGKVDDSRDDIGDDDDDKDSPDDEQPSILEEKINYGKIPWIIYRKYLTSGGYVCFMAVLVSFILTQLIASATDYFEAFWVNLVEDHATPTYADFFTTENCIYIYTGLIASVITITISRSIFFFVYFLRVSVKIHNKMFSAVINTTMDFFHSTPSGRILNRFCNDIGAIDEILPPVLMDTVQIGLNVLAITLIITIVNKWIVVVNISMLLAFYSFRRFYLVTGRHIKRLTATTRSPVLSHLNSSLNGLETIRAFGVEEHLRMQFDQLQNVHTSTFYMFLACTTTFGFWLDMFCALYISLVATSFYWSNYTQGGSVGLLITQAMGLTGMFQWGMKQWTELENHMVSVERVFDYTTNNRSEEIDTVVEAPDDWPQNYQIHFDSVTMKYNEESLALNHLNFTIEAKEKVGVIGRTGAGKSSIISALFRLVQFDGTISIGNVNINDLPLEKVRSKISIIPQEPILFSGTIRQNLDPLCQFDDSKLWSVLDELGLKQSISTNGLDMRLFEGGANFSVGQRQLLCLARALLRENRIVVLDEATANLDLETDLVIRTTMAKKFIDCTVIIIAHRLPTIMDCDKVLVMDSGRIVEYDHPFKLMLNQNGALREFVRKCGKTATNSLMETAEKNYYRNKQFY